MTYEKYALYVGDTIPTISLWVRRNDKEYPIYANTRGQSEWYTFDPDVYENTHTESLSECLKDWLAHYYRVTNGLLESESESMFLADHVREDRPEDEPEAWYEVELLNAIGQPGWTREQEQLVEWAYNEVNEE